MMVVGLRRRRWRRKKNMTTWIFIFYFLLFYFLFFIFVQKFDINFRGGSDFRSLEEAGKWVGKNEGHRPAFLQNETKTQSGTLLQALS